LPLKIKVAN